MAYPTGAEVIEAGQCPLGGTNPMACMFCPFGHMLECHYPHSCEEAQCGHLEQYIEPEGFVEFPDDFDMADPECQICGCTESCACPGGCGWSEAFLRIGQLVCTKCELTIIINLSALRILEAGATVGVRT